MYISFFDKSTGERITSIVLDVHFTVDNKSEVVAQYLAEYPNAVAVELTEEQYHQQLNNNLVLKNGQLVEAPAKAEDVDFDKVQGGRNANLLKMSNEDLQNMVMVLSDRVDTLEGAKESEEE